MSTTTTVYKLTRPDLTTYQGYQYQMGRMHTFPGTGPLCASGWSHAYLSPQLAVLLNPIHANYDPFVLWKAKGIIGIRDHDLKVGCSSLTLMSQIEVPDVTIEQRVMFGIYCALVVPTNSPFVEWAERWLSGEDRSSAAARTAAYAADAAYAAYAAAAAYAADAAYAAYADAAADAAAAAAAAADAAYAAYHAAYAAYHARASHPFDLIEIAASLLPWEPKA